MRQPICVDEEWLVPARREPWFTWGFGTRASVLRNELASVTQVHGAAVLPVSAPGLAGEADALVTQTAGLLLGIKTADCLPILMVDLKQRAVAAVHAGWRGTVQGVAAAAVQAMGEKYETKPNDLLVAFGPAIRKCCFEVGAEVASQFAGFDQTLQGATGKRYLDLQAINAWGLERVGVLPTNIVRNELCTMCDAEQFWSFRRDGEKAGRMRAVVGIQA